MQETPVFLAVLSWKKSLKQKSEFECLFNVTNSLRFFSLIIIYCHPNICCLFNKCVATAILKLW